MIKNKEKQSFEDFWKKSNWKDKLVGRLAFGKKQLKRTYYKEGLEKW